ncbi:MAG TPA: glycerophosphodiester phosphodiesterase [Gemmatimonadaceae bacterium]
MAHRGLHADVAENSSSAFRLALDAGADAIELDVHATRDGHVVVHHDFAVRRHRAVDTRRISDIDYNELRSFALSDGSPIPTLAEVLHETPSTVDLYIEVKPPGIERLVVDCILGSVFPVERCAIHSFDHRISRNSRKLCSFINTGLLVVGYPLDATAMLRGADARDFWLQWEFVDAEIVEEIHAAHGRVVAWTCNDSAGWDRLVSFGVDALCTDKVDELVAWRSSLSANRADQSLTT